MKDPISKRVEIALAYWANKQLMEFRKQPRLPVKQPDTKVKVMHTPKC